MNLFTKQKQKKKAEKKQKSNLQLLMGKQGLINWEIGIDRYRHIHIKEISNKELLGNQANKVVNILKELYHLFLSNLCQLYSIRLFTDKNEKHLL